MSTTLTTEEYIQLAVGFLATMDAQGDIFSLMTDDVEFTFPKWGVANGKADLPRFFQALGSYVAAISHPPEHFRFTTGDRRVCIEGISKGRLQNGKTWDAGRFCVVYEFEGALIKQVGIYIDPDYCDETSSYYPWNRSG